MPSCNTFALANLSTTVSTLSTTVSTLSAMLSCNTGGRRLDDDDNNDRDRATAKDVMDTFLATRPALAAKMDGELRAGMEELGQHFGLPAHA